MDPHPYDYLVRNLSEIRRILSEIRRQVLFSEYLTYAHQEPMLLAELGSVPAKFELAFRPHGEESSRGQEEHRSLGCGRDKF